MNNLFLINTFSLSGSHTTIFKGGPTFAHPLNPVCRAPSTSL